MKSDEFNLPKGADMSDCVDRIAQYVAAGGAIVTIRQRLSKRTNQQNRYLFGVCYPTILERLQGWDKDDIHEFCLGEWGGWEIVEGFGKRRQRPIRRSSKLSKLEFMDFVGHIQRTMAERGIYIPDPQEYLQ